jgi:hypothetical protein
MLVHKKETSFETMPMTDVRSPNNILPHSRKPKKIFSSIIPMVGAEVGLLRLKAE